MCFDKILDRLTCIKVQGHVEKFNVMVVSLKIIFYPFNFNFKWEHFSILLSCLKLYQNALFCVVFQGCVDIFIYRII